MHTVTPTRRYPRGNTEGSTSLCPNARSFCHSNPLGSEALCGKDPAGKGDGGLSWVWAAPLWGNPLLPHLPAPDLALLPGMGTVGGALQ